VAVAGLLDRAASPFAIYVFAHGVGAGMRHPFMQAIADASSPIGAEIDTRWIPGRIWST